MSEQNGADNVSGPVPWLVETWDDDDFRKMGNDQVLSAAVRQIEWMGESQDWDPGERHVREMLVAGGHSLPHFYLPPHLKEAKNILEGVAGWGLDSMDMHTFLGLEDVPFAKLIARMPLQEGAERQRGRRLAGFPKSEQTRPGVTRWHRSGAQSGRSV